MKETIRNANGQIAAYVSTADGTGRGTLVCVHGGPNGDHRGNNDVFEELRSYAPSMGYNVIQFDMYGAGNSDGGPADISLRSQLIDYNSVVDFSRERFNVPVHVVGESMGGTIPALEWREGIASYILLWPAFDLRDTDLRPYLTDAWLKEAARRGQIDDSGMILGREFLQELVDHDFARCFCLPKVEVLIVHGKQDAAVPFQQSLDAVRSAQGRSVLFAHPEGDHGLQRPDEREFTHRAIKWWLTER